MSKAHKQLVNDLERDMVFHLFRKHGHADECKVCRWLDGRLKQLQEQRPDLSNRYEHNQ